jgi:hypothetical protein
VPEKENEGVVNLLLPQGREPEFYHRLSRQLVGEYATLSRLESMAPPGTPLLNDSTWTLSVPTAAGRGVADIERKLQSLPEARGTRIERPTRFGISEDE